MTEFRLGQTIKMVGVGVFRVAAQNLAAKARRIGKLAGLKALQGLLHRVCHLQTIAPMGRPYYLPWEELVSIFRVQTGPNR